MRFAWLMNKSRTKIRILAGTGEKADVIRTIRVGNQRSPRTHDRVWGELLAKDEAERMVKTLNRANGATKERLLRSIQG